MKKSVNIIILLVVLALLGGAYAFVKNRPAKKDNSTQSTTSSTSAQVLKLDKDKINKITLINKSGTVVFQKNGKDWTIPAVSYKLSQSKLTDFVNSFASLTAQKVVDKNASDLSKYGLSKPVDTAVIELSDGTKKEVYIGNATPENNSSYAIVKGSSTVYTLLGYSVGNFEKVASDMRDINMPTIKSADLNYVKIAQKGQKTLELKLNDSQTKEEAQYGVNGWTITQPYSKMVTADTEKVTNITNAVSAVSVNNVVEDSAKDLKTYGLDDPAMDLTIKDKSNTLEILVGKDKDDNYAYCKLPNSNTIYTIDKTKLTPFQVKAFDLSDKFAGLVNIEDVDKIQLKNSSVTHNMTISRTTKKAEKKDDKDEVVASYDVDGKNIKEDNFKKFYQDLVGLAVDSEIDKQVDDKPEVSLVYTLNKSNPKQITIDFASYNDQFYAVFYNGKCDFVISKDKVSKILDEVKNLK